MEINHKAVSHPHLPRLFRLVEWQPNTNNLDIGGGKYFTTTRYLREKGVRNIVYDPYNKPLAWQNYVEKLMETLEFQTVTLSNVLNCIETVEEREELLKMAMKYATKNIYIKVYHGNTSRIPGFTKMGTWQNNQPLGFYLPEIEKICGGYKYYEKIAIVSL